MMGCDKKKNPLNVDVASMIIGVVHDQTMQDEQFENDVKSAEMKLLLSENFTYTGRLGSRILEKTI